MTLLHDFLHLFYPELCEACSSALYKNENLICLRCLAKLPYTSYENISPNKTDKLFWGRIRIEKATSLLFFTKGSRVQVLMHGLKYKGRKDIGFYLGELMYHKLHKANWLDSVDCIMPVPMHSAKQKKRGYNQAELIAQGLSTGSGIPLNLSNLRRVKNVQSQTKKSRIERYENMLQVFEVESFEEQIPGHVLLIDDIITTGATIEACALVLLESGVKKVSVATLACTFT